jgi:SOS-response transcriptional repressor LexA
MVGLTRNMQRTLEFIHAQVRSTGVPPTYQQIADHFGVASKSNAHRIVSALERRGYIRRTPHLPQSMEVLHLPPAPAVTLNHEILTLTDRYGAEHQISRDTAVNELIRTALQVA